jgi:hypothetical protein
MINDDVYTYMFISYPWYICGEYFFTLLAHFFKCYLFLIFKCNLHILDNILIKYMICKPYINVWLVIFFLLAVLEFELRALYLLGRFSIMWAMPVPFLL